MNSAENDDNLHTFISAHGRIQAYHDLDYTFDKMKFLGLFRDKYRICWKEIYIKLTALVENPLLCNKCDEWFPITLMGDCQ